MGDTFEFNDKLHTDRLTGTLHDPGATVGDVLTVQADKSIAAAAGGGGSSPISVATVTLSPADLEDLAANPVTIVPAPGAGKVINVIGLWVNFAPGTTPYTDNGGFPGVQTANEQTPWMGNIFGAGFWDNSQANFVAGLNPALIGGNGGDATAMDNQPVQFVNSGGPGTDPTGGDGSVIVSLTYHIVEITA